MKIEIEPYNENWKEQFEIIRNDLKEILLPINPKIDHIGSTSIIGLSAKPIIDILIGVEKENQLDKSVALLSSKDYIYFEIYNAIMPYRRFFVKTKNIEKTNLIIQNEDDIEKNLLAHKNRIAHIHIIPKKSIHWSRHIAFKEYLTRNLAILMEYQNLKLKLSENQWLNGNDYNAAKNDFIKYHEKIALKEFETNNKSKQQ